MVAPQESVDDCVSAVKSFVLASIGVAPERDGQLLADGLVGEGVEGGGVAAVQPALLERPQGRDDQVVLPVWSVFAQGTAGLQVDDVARQRDSAK